MAKSIPSETVLKIRGKKLDTKEVSTANANTYFNLEASYSLSATRAEGEENLITLSDKDYVQLVFEDSTTWFGDSATLRELFPEINLKTRSGEPSELPNQLQSDDATRGIVGQLALKLFNKFSKKTIDTSVQKIAENLQTKSLEGRSGLYTIDENFAIQNFKSIDDSKPVLLFIHGTASSTRGSFSELKPGNIWKEITSIYGSNILAFEHETLTKSPLQNVFELIKQLPANITIDIISHSRGGLVGDTLVRFLNSPEGFLDESIELLKEEERTQDLEFIASLQKIAASKKIRINRFVRVACPARGTSLLGNRIDIFLNVLINLITISNPVLSFIVDEIKVLISQVLETKSDVNVLPGLEAMNPDSPFLKALNTPGSFENDKPEGIANTLLVISGSSKINLSLNGLKALLTKFFFKWNQNDLVVDTASMYQGARRKESIQYFFDEENNVNHFNYFTNKKTQDAILLALTSASDHISTFKEMDMENYNVLSRGVFGLDGGKLPVTRASGKKPVVLLLPGIMGSFLERGDKALWINYLSFVVGGLTKLKIENTDIQATGVIKTAYKDLVEYLSAFYDVEVFPFDWRRSISDAGTALQARIVELQQLKQPVSLIGHSMGGLIIRDMAINYPDIWNWLNTQPSFRTILLGTPWMGSYRIPHVLSGKDSIIKQLDTIDFIHSRGKLINMFSKFPGLLGLLPIRNNDIDFSNKKEWEAFASSTGLKWDIPSDQLLAEFGTFKYNVTAKIDQLNHDNIIYVAGKDDQTVSGYTIANGTLQFTTTAEGDQSVTWESGIPKSINKQTSLYYTQATHGGLSMRKYLFQGIKDLLDRGTTASAEFSRKPLPSTTQSRGLSKEYYNFENTDRSIENNLLGLGEDLFTDATSTPILKISVSKGDMIYSRYPVLMGHFENDGLYDAEKTADKYVNNILALKHSLGIYPGPIGTHSFFKENKALFKGCMIVGLGQAENLNSFQLSKSIESAVADYLLTNCRNNIGKANQKNKIGLSSLIVGAGYGGMAIENSCRAIMQGIINANDKVMKLTGVENLYVDELEFIELFEDKSISLFYSLSNLINGNSDGMNIFWKEKKIKNLLGARKRLIADNTISWWQRLSVIETDSCQTPNKNTTDKTLSYYSSTNNAREEKKEMHHNLPLIETLLDDISIKRNWSFDKAKAIFELLIPTEFKEKIRRNSPILWVLDKFTASFPWELLQTGAASDKPLCVTAGMIRQLATSDYKPGNPVKANNVLIIGDPYLNNFSKAGQLIGAEKEAQLVFNKFKDETELNVEAPLIKSNSDEIITALFKQDYKILHIAGHGFFDEHNPSSCGILIGKMKDNDEPMFLTPHHINQLPSIPEFVFINCCFLGRINPYAEEYSANRFRLAANIGTQLIENGVKAVIVAGWEVDDVAALKFAETFYERMLAGAKFGDAVLEARKEIYNNFRHSNTWGAFQCYGQQHFTLDLKRPNKFNTEPYYIEQEAENDLDNLLSKTEVAFYEPDHLLIELKNISQKILASRFTNAELQQKEAQAYMELNDYETAIKKYDILFQNETAKYSVMALENYQNMVINKETEYFFNNPKDLKIILEKINTSISNLNYLLKICDTGERFALLGSAYKRRAIILPNEKKNEAQKAADMEASANYYRLAYNKLKNAYSYVNWIIMEKFLVEKKTRKWGHSTTGDAAPYKLPTLAQIEKDLSNIEKELSPDDEMQGYWSITETADITLCRFMLDPTGKNFKTFSQTLRHIWAIAGSTNKQQKQIVNLRVLTRYANYTGLTNIEQQLEDFVKNK